MGLLNGTVGPVMGAVHGDASNNGGYPIFANGGAPNWGGDISGFFKDPGGTMASQDPSAQWGHSWAKATHGPTPPTLQQVPGLTAPTMITPSTAQGLGLSRPAIVGPGNMTAATVGPFASTQSATVAMPQHMGDFSSTIGTADQNSQGRQAQNAAMSFLTGQATGQGPSLAAMQLQQGQQANMAQQFALANSARGGQQASALRNAQNNAGQIGGNMAQQSAMARLAEQQQAAGTLGNIAQGSRGQDLQAGTGMAQLQQGAAGTNLGMDMQGALANAGFQQGANMQNGSQGFGAAVSNAGFNQGAGMANLNAGVQTGIAQGQLDQGWNNTNLGFTGLGVQAGADNQGATLGFNANQIAGTQATNDALLKQYGIGSGLFGNGMMAGGTGLAALAALLGGGGGAAAAGGGTAGAGAGESVGGAVGGGI